MPAESYFEDQQNTPSISTQIQTRGKIAEFPTKSARLMTTPSMHKKIPTITIFLVFSTSWISVSASCFPDQQFYSLAIPDDSSYVLTRTSGHLLCSILLLTSSFKAPDKMAQEEIEAINGGVYWRQFIEDKYLYKWSCSHIIYHFTE